MAQVGLGTYQLGRDTYQVCRAALELGYRHIDTASLYNNEEAVGDAVRESGIDRSQITVTSKVWVDDIRSGTIAEAVARSVSCIGQVDVMLLHAPVGSDAELDKSWVALLAACDSNGVGAAGVSNYRRVHLDALRPQPVVNQIETSVFLPRTDLVRHCHANGIEVTAHSPLVKARRLDHPVICEIAAEIMVEGRPATPAQIMLAWLLYHGAMPLPRSRSTNRLAENFAASTIALADDQLGRLAAIEDGFATHPQHR